MAKEIDNCCLTSKKMLFVSLALMALIIIATSIIVALYKELILKLSFNPDNNIIVNIISSTNSNQSVKLNFLFIENEDLLKLFNLYEKKSINLIELKKELSLQICSQPDLAWKQFCLLDSNENLKLYYKYCQEFLKDQSQFPNSSLTTEQAQLFIKKFDVLEKAQGECNKIGQLFFVGCVLAGLFAISLLVFGTASCRILFCSADDGAKEQEQTK